MYCIILIIHFSLAKEIVYYEKEAEREEARHNKMKGEGADEYQLRKQVPAFTVL